MSKIKIENVSYIYDGGTPFETVALNDINIEIREKTVTGIIGHTGSGKSTLVQMFNGLIRPTSGRILLDGEDIWKKPKDISKVRFRVGLVMQYPEYQLFEETVRADIAFGPKNMGLNDAETEQRVMEAASFVGLDEPTLDRSPFDLSGGQKRRAAIAGVMAMRPEVLVLDEPSAGLDPAGRNSIFDGIKRYAEASGAAVIIVSHSMDDMARYCEELVVLSQSRVVMQGKRHEVFCHGDELEAIGLGVPQMTGLMMLLRQHGLDVPSDIYTVDDAEKAVAKLFGGAL